MSYSQCSVQSVCTTCGVLSFHYLEKKRRAGTNASLDKIPFIFKKSVAWSCHSLLILSYVGVCLFFSFARGREIFWWGCGERCFAVRGRSWFHWWRNWAVLLWGHGRRSRQVLPPRERPGIASVRCTYAYIWAGGSPSHARRLSLLRDIKKG
jgi:hypothetical protein